MRSFLSVPANEIDSFLASRGGKPFHRASIEKWVLQRAVFDFAKMSDLPAGLREALAREFVPIESKIVDRREASDGTVKLLLELRDGERIETVVMPGTQGKTICVSTQVGCPVACRFCASGMNGLVRNLDWWEILEQFLQGRTIAPLGRAVVMGIGEPTLNLENLLRALDIVTSPKGLGLGARRVTVSTIGIPDRIRAFAGSGKAYNLAVSLHAPNDRLRKEIIPTMDKVTIEELLKAAHDYFEATGREVTFEYVMLAGVNDLASHARELAERLRGTRSTVNLIPYNSVPQFEYRRPKADSIQYFSDTLRRAGIPATVRWSKGLEADAACGQLRIASVPKPA